jgi:hypothetical protein
VQGHLEHGLSLISLPPLLKHTPTTSLCSNPLFDIRKHSESIDEWQLVQFFSHMEEFNDTPLIRTHFHVRYQSARLLLCYLLHNNKTYKLLVGMFNLYCHAASIRL